MPQSYRSAAAAGSALIVAAAVVMSQGCDAVPASVSDSWGRRAGEAHADKLSAVRFHPLSALPEEDNDAAVTQAPKRRPIMVMINNHPAARPQSGLSRADVIVECLAEGEITRIAAFYEGGTEVPGMIGPVRSIRPYYIDLGRMFDAIEVHAGGSPDAYAQLGGEHIDHLDEITNAGRFFWRESFRKLPHNLYTDMELLRVGAAKLKMRTEQRRPKALAFAKDQAPGTPGVQAPRDSMAIAAERAENVSGTTAAHLDVTFQFRGYVVSYDYDASAGVYRRFMNGQPHMDLNDGSQLAAANVVVLGADHKVLDAEGRREVRLTGSGPAVTFRRGVAVRGTWRRSEAQDTFQLIAPDGSRVALAPGRAHCLIVPNAPTFARHVKY